MKENLLRKEVKWETKGDYVLWIKELQSKWREIEAIVCDGKRWLLVWFPGIPTQMCIFHQQQIIRRYITRSPKLEANIEFKELSSMIGKARKETMKIWLEDRYRKHEKFLKERNDKWKIVHTRTMKAYKSVKRNLEYLYTYEECKDSTGSHPWFFLATGQFSIVQNLLSLGILYIFSQFHHLIQLY